MTAAVAPAYEVCVKGFPKSGNDGFEGTLGDCPFSQKVMLALEEKQIPYKKHLINEYEMPDWVEKANPNKKVPFMKDLQEDKWVDESSNMLNYIESKHPEPKLGTVEEAPKVAENLFGAFTEYLKVKEGAPEEAAKRKDLEAQLQELEDFLKPDKKFVGGDRFSAADARLAPQLNHIKLAVGHFKKVSIFEQFPTVARYMDNIMSRDSWKHTVAPSEDIVISGWQKKRETWGTA